MSSFITYNRLSQKVACYWTCSASNTTTPYRYNTELLLQKAVISHPGIPADIIEIEIRKDSHNRTREMDPRTGANHFRPDDWHVTANFRNARQKASGRHIPAHIYHVVGDIAMLERVQSFDEKNDSEAARDASPPRAHCVNNWQTMVASHAWAREDQPASRTSHVWKQSPCGTATGHAMGAASWRVC